MLVDDALGVLDVVVVQLAPGHGIGLGEFLGDGLEQLGEQAVVGGLGHGVMEGRVEFLPLLGVEDVQALPHLLQHRSDVIQLFFRGPFGRQAGGGGLEDAPHLEHVQE